MLMTRNWIAAGALCLALTPAHAQNLTISSSLPQVHFWTGQGLDPFADAVQASSDITFTRFYAGELTGVGRGLDALQGGTVDAVYPLLAPYHAGQFPLTDVTQLPVYDTSSAAATRAFQKLMDDSTDLKDGKTFYAYEIGDKGIVAWGLGATGAYAISTASQQITSVDQFKGLQLRAGAALQTMTLEQLGVTPVTIPAADLFEAISRKTLDGTLLSVGDWKSYSLIGALQHTIDGVSLGHWESYNALSQSAWNAMSDEAKAAYDKAARETALKTAEYIDALEAEVRSEAAGKGAEFTQISAMSQGVQDHVADAAMNAWVQWIETTEANGHPAKATAVLWAKLIQDEGGKLPAGVQDYLNK